jgi:hypothetical protein
MFGQFLPNKNKILQYATVEHSNLAGPQFGPTKQNKALVFTAFPRRKTVWFQGLIVMLTHRRKTVARTGQQAISNPSFYCLSFTPRAGSSLDL